MEEISKNTNAQNDNRIYLKNVHIENYGAITKLNYECQFDENGNPLPIVLVGKNGSGKTLFLSNILHSLIETKRQIYSEIPEVDGDNFYRVGSKDYIQENKEFSYVHLDYSCNINFTSTVVRNPETFDFEKLKEYKNINRYDEGFKQTGFFDNSIKCSKEIFDQNVFLYFPVDRYYYPKWLNQNNKKLSFLMAETFLGKTKSDIIKDNLLDEVEPWILDVIIDKYLYEQKTLVYEKNGNSQQFLQYLGKNTQIQEQINSIIRKIFPNCEKYNSARIGISTKQNRKISIMAKDREGNTIELNPTFQNLSSGEIMILSLFCSILKEADKLSNNAFLNMSEISGIVLIDEIDSHLHSNFAKEILPEVMSLFPKIQFIVSSHSPFYLLGMKQKFDNKCVFITMPEGTIMPDVENFEEIQRCYEMLDSNHNKLLKALTTANEQISILEKTLIVTEGKTDWKHIKAALGFYKKVGKYEDLDIDFWEYEEEFGDSKLETLLKNLAKIDNKHKIIGIFDSDDKIGKNYMALKYFGHNVFGVCIPENINYPEGISIEFLYIDDDIKKYDSEGRRLYLANEFTQHSRRLMTNNTISTTNNKVESYYKTGIVKIIDEDVYDINENSIALSKNEFAKKVLNKIAPFDIMDFSGFIPLLDNIEDIIKNK